MKVVVTGATGFIGQALVRALRAQGDEVIALTRDAARARSVLGAEVTAVTAELENRGAWTSVLAGADAVINLAGEPVAAKRWNARQKQRIRDSRVESTRTIVEAIGALPAADRPRALINASGIDYYPFALEALFDDDEVTEADPAGGEFLARVSRDSEAEAAHAEPFGVRVAVMRTGLVLDAEGPLEKLALPFKLFVGGRLGSGRQWLPWIHRDDAVAAYIAAARDDRYRGPINLVTAAARNRDFARAVGKALHRPSWLPLPGFALRAIAGEMARSILHGRRVVPARLRELGFTWLHPTLEGALAASVR